MAEFRDNKKQKVPSATQSEKGSVNPSAPTSGTEGYGMQEGEFTNLKEPARPSSERAEQPGDVRKTSYPQTEGSHLMENQSRQDALRENPNARQGKQFNCADVGNMNCNWSVVAENEDEVLSRAEQHGREAHGMKDIDDKTRQKIRGAIRDKAA
jgi:predicted small metal-binding protein